MRYLVLMYTSVIIMSIRLQ